MWWPLAIPIAVALNALVLAGVIFLVARTEADLAGWKVFLVSLGISVAGGFLSGCVVTGLGRLGIAADDWRGKLTVIGLCGAVALWATTWIIARYLCLIPRDAFVASVVYFTVNTALVFLAMLFL